jgi:tetratricopeptide (TPR) repeat protein
MLLLMKLHLFFFTRFSLLLLIFLTQWVNLFAQDPRLASQYMQNGEFEKAAEVYEELLKKSPNNEYYFTNYIDCLLQLEQYDQALKTVKKELEKNTDEPKLYMIYGRILDRKGQQDEAVIQYEKAIQKMRPDRNLAFQMSNEFISQNKYQLASKVLEKALQLLPGDRTFAYQLGDLYRRSGDEVKMVYYYLEALEGNTVQLETIKTIFQRYLDVDGQKEVQKQLYERIQKNQSNTVFPELLAWLFIINKDFTNALRQLRALDRRLNEDGLRVFNFAYTASYEQAYDVALEAFNYVIEEKGRSSRYYLEAQKGRLNTMRKQIMQEDSGNKVQLKKLESEFQNFLEEYGKNSATAQIITELADLQAYYINDLDAAIKTLEGLIGFRSVNSYTLANAKLSLGDFYLMSGNRWEATLLYSQVDKDFGDEILGQEARFRNAKLSYYVGDFEWAQSQFDILKSATSRFVSNDAIDLSVFIMDNMGLDTTDIPLRIYANAELLVFQNRFDEAKQELSILRKDYPEHKLEDDILYLEAEILMKLRRYSEAVEKYQHIVDHFSEEIRADDSLFALGDLYENHLNDPEKAKSYYERIIFEYSNSILAIEARKRYRLLRGDNI